MPSNTNSDAGAIYVQWSDDGQHIRKWSRGPFEGAVMFHQSETGAALTSDGGREAIKAIVYRAYCAGFNDRPGEQFWNDREAEFDAAIAALAQPVEAGEDGT